MGFISISSTYRLSESVGAVFVDPLGLAWWAEVDLKIVALSMFMATAVFAITACLMARFFLWYFEKLVFTVCICTPARGGKKGQLRPPQKFLVFCGGCKVGESY